MHKKSHQHNSKNIKAFTLVELAIVTVILGLIISGTIGAQSLIKSGKMTAQVSQLEKFDSAIMAFKLEYDALAGDMNKSEAQSYGLTVFSGNGYPAIHNGNGYLNDRGGNAPMSRADGEAPYVFTHLSDAQITQGYNTHESSGFTKGEDFPIAKIAEIGIIPTSLSDGKLYWYLGQSSNTTNGDLIYGLASEAKLPTIDAHKLDKKIDDGTPSTGIVRAVRANFTPDVTANGCVLTATAESYNIQSSDDYCRITIKSDY